MGIRFPITTQGGLYLLYYSLDRDADGDTGGYELLPPGSAFLHRTGPIVLHDDQCENFRAGNTLTSISVQTMEDISDITDLFLGEGMR